MLIALAFFKPDNARQRLNLLSDLRKRVQRWRDGEETSSALTAEVAAQRAGGIPFSPFHWDLARHLLGEYPCGG